MLGAPLIAHIESHRMKKSPWPMSALATVRAISALALAASLVPLAAQAADVGVSVSISQPGVYGRVDIGRFPQPQLIVQQPVIAYREARQPAPVYMFVPPGHRKNWKRHCRDYGACGVPVYFVQDRWYEREVRPHAHDRPGRGNGDGNKHGDKHGEKRGKGDRGDDRADRGEGRGNGKHDRRD
jgi:hypothetical protein